MSTSVGFTGTQQGMTDAQRYAVREWLGDILKVNRFHHGDCIGADATAHAIASSLKIPITIHPPLDSSKRAWMEADDIREPREYLARNRDIVLESDILLACPKGFEEEIRSGTWSTVRFAVKRQRKVFIIWPDGRTATPKEES